MGNLPFPVAYKERKVFSTFCSTDEASPLQCGRQGQAAVEYLIVAGMLILTASIFAVFLYTFKEQSGRILSLMASEYP